MRKLFVTCAAAAMTALLATGCGSSTGTSVSQGGKPTSAASVGANPSSDTAKSGQPTKGSTNNTPTDAKTPSPDQPGNPCEISNRGLAFEAMYGGNWKQLSDDNPPESGEYKQRECVFEANVPGMYQGNNGPAYVKAKVVTYIDDTSSTLFNQLVQNAKSRHAYYPAQPGVDGTAGEGAFYDGDPGNSAIFTLTSRDELDPVIIMQVVVVSDQYRVFYDDPYHYAALVDTMHYIQEKMQP